MAAVERDVLDSGRRDHVAEGGAGAIEQRRLRSDHDLCPHGRDVQTKVADYRPPDIEAKGVEALGTETGRLRRDRVDAVRDPEDVVAPLSVGPDRDIETHRAVPYPDHGAAKDGAGHVQDAPLKRGQRLRVDRRSEHVQHQQDDRRAPASSAARHGQLWPIHGSCV